MLKRVLNWEAWPLECYVEDDVALAFDRTTNLRFTVQDDMIRRMGLEQIHWLFQAMAARAARRKETTCD